MYFTPLTLRGVIGLACPGVSVGVKLAQAFFFAAHYAALGLLIHLIFLVFSPLDEIITLASIVQEESYTNASVKNVASVLHNRLDSPNFRRLQCDVTKNYIRTNIDNSPYLTGDTDAFAELYNTYECFGLPVGPITNPGLASIEAALYPAETNYFYFVTDSQWNYYYAETYAQHKANCSKVGLKG